MQHDFLIVNNAFFAAGLMLAPLMLLSPRLRRSGAAALAPAS